jgi:hypothetical protein
MGTYTASAMDEVLGRATTFVLRFALMVRWVAAIK